MRQRIGPSSACALFLLAALSAGCVQPKVPKFGLSGGLLGSARTDLGLGYGWTVSANMRYNPMPFFDMDFLQLEVSGARYEHEVDIARIAFGGVIQSRPHIFGLSGATHFGEKGIWGAGPGICYGFGVFEEDNEYYVLVSGYVWLGERSDQFDVGAEADIRLCAGIRF